MTKRDACSGRHRGAILIAAIIVVFAISGMVIVLCQRMSIEAIASANDAAAMQAASVERGGEQYILGVLTDTTQSPLSIPNENFAYVPVGDGYFWVLRPDYDDNSLPIYGVTDECGKLDINYATYDMLMRLPGMTQDVAAAIVDWHDGDDNSDSHGGAESSYYLSLPQPYNCKNAPFETVEELLLVRGVTPQLLYGDGSAPPIGTSSNTQTFGGTVGQDPQLARGLYDLLTVYSAAPNTQSGGSPRVNLNDRNALQTLLRRQLGNARGSQIIALLGRAPVLDIFDLYTRGRLTQDEFDKVGDSLTVTNGNRRRGVVNVNTAPRDVLLCLPNLDTGDVDKLISQRPAIDASNASSITWIATALSTKAIGLGNLITGSTSRYSADILAVSGNGRGYKRCRIVVDTTNATAPRVIYRRDLTDRGWPLDPQILASLRAGQVPAGVTNPGGGMLR